MQPVKLGALVWCCVPAALLASLVLPPASRAQQAVLETPQEVNDRIRSLSASARAVQHDYIIGNGDLMDLEVFDVKELSREVRVSQTGSIGIPLVPVRLHVAGLTEVQAEQKISEVLEANGLVSHAEVSISVKERKSKPITVVGAISHPMVYQADRPVSLLEVLAEAGGLANDAGDTVIVNRPAQETPSDSTEPPAIGPEDHPAAVVSNGSPHSGPAQQPHSSTTAAPNASADPPPIDPPHLNNTITINLNELLESGNAPNNVILHAGDIVTVTHTVI